MTDIEHIVYVIGWWQIGSWAGAALCHLVLKPLLRL